MPNLKIPAARITIPDEDIAEMLPKFQAILKSGQLTLGPYTQEFEKAFAEHHGNKHAVAVNSGTSSLEIILRCLEAEDKKVIVPANTFFATAAAAVHAGGKVAFVDSAPDHLMADADKLEKMVDKKTGAVVLVHTGGYVHPDIRRIQDLCDDKGVPLVEDAAHAHGSRFDGEFAGKFGRASSFSFYPTKVITSGEGGMIVTDDEEIAKRARVFRDQGKAGFTTNFHTELGYNWRLSELNALLGVHQMKRLGEFVKRRQAAAKIYDKGLEGLRRIRRVGRPKESEPNFYKYLAVLDPKVNRLEVKKTLKEKFDVSLSGEVYDTPLHLQPIFKKLVGAKPGQFPVAEEVCARHVCLPMYPYITPQEQEHVLASVAEVLG
ncbi:MAG: DegT/DnrJ/EryC1/StrS family aminotransferase [Halobacteria archaeon]